ncbi:MAG: hypothetical protein IJD60_08095 [Clostridia bacterium]|nr:hypothetical protein [Clostridia bacterium]
MDDKSIEMRNRKYFVDKMITVRDLDAYQEEYLYAAAQKGEIELMEAMYRVYGIVRDEVLSDTAHRCWQLMVVIGQLMEEAGPRCSEGEWNYNREGLKECLCACECALELARKHAHEECGGIAMLVDWCRQIERKNRMRLLV